MSDYFLGEIKMYGFQFQNAGFVYCSGQLLSIADNSALYALIGTTYGGDGQTTFAVPDFRGRMPIHQGTGPGLTTRTIGQLSGTETVTLTTTEMPSHNHNVIANNVKGADDVPTANSMPSQAVQAVGGQSSLLYTTSGAVPIQPKPMLPQAIGVTGGSQAHNNVMPFLTLNFCIAVQGIFPTRN